MDRLAQYANIAVHLAGAPCCLREAFEAAEATAAWSCEIAPPLPERIGAAIGERYAHEDAICCRDHIDGALTR